MARQHSKLGEKAFALVGLFCLSLSTFVLASLIVTIIIDGWDRLSIEFLSGYPSRRASRAGIAPALVGSAYLMAIVAVITLPLGVGAAIYLEEYAKKNRFSKLLELNINNLAGVPSIIYGILGLQLFVRFMHLERSLLAGGLTLSLLVLPVIIIAAREAISRVPNSIREAAHSLGATKWEVIRDQVIPAALPGIMTGSILAFSRAIGETAPLVTLGALTYVAFLPDSIFSPFTALPIQAFNWTSRPQEAFHQNAAAAIVVLLFLLLLLNISAVIIRKKFERRYAF